MKQLKYKINDECIVSTVYAPDVELFETILIYENKHVLADRYKTEEEAIAGHQEVIDNVKNGKIYDGIDELFDNDPVGYIEKFFKCLVDGKYND